MHLQLESLLGSVKKKEDILGSVLTPSFPSCIVVYTTASSPLYNGSQALVSCHVELDPTLVDPETSVIVTWKFGTFEVFGDNLLTVSPLVGDGRTYQRNLTFQVLLISDTGSWLCEATVVTLGGNRSTNTSTIYLSVEGMYSHLH